MRTSGPLEQDGTERQVLVFGLPLSEMMTLVAAAGSVLLRAANKKHNEFS